MHLGGSRSIGELLAAACCRRRGGGGGAVVASESRAAVAVATVPELFVVQVVEEVVTEVEA